MARMNSVTRSVATENQSPLDNLPLVVRGIPVLAIDTPVLFEDEGQDEMGDSAPHSTATQILSCGIEAHIGDRTELQVYANLNLMYHPINVRAYVSPDVMVVTPFRPLSSEISSFRIGKQGPAPLMVLEVLSDRTAQQGDLTLKPRVYADSGVSEYLLVDTSGEYLKERLLLKKLGRARKWVDHQDDDGGVTSALGFRVIIDNDGLVRVIDAESGFRYVRPREATPLFLDLNEKYEQERAKALRASKRAEAEHKKSLRKLEQSAVEIERLKSENQQSADENQRLDAELQRLRKLLPPDRRG